MIRRLRWTAILAAMTVMLGGLAAAQHRDDDDYNRDHKQKNEYKNRDWDRNHSWNDHDRDDRWRNRDRDDRWRDRDGDRDDAWRRRDRDRDGDRDRDRNHSWGWGNQTGTYGNYPYGNYPYGNYPYGNYPYGYPTSRTYPYSMGSWGGYGRGSTAATAGYNQGYQDGQRVGESDQRQGKPFQSYPRGDYKASDHGYHSGYGDKGTYQQSYLQGYERGYRSVYGGGGYGRGY